MKPLILLPVLLLSAVFAQLLQPAAAQDEGLPPAAATAGDPHVAVDTLRLQLKPLTKEELETELAAWIALLKNKAAALSEAEIRSKEAEGDAKAALLEAANGLRDEVAAIANRAQAVIDAFEAKGGEAENHEAYIAVVTGLTIEVTDTSALWTTIRGWLISEEGGIRWAVNIGRFLVVLILFWILALLLGGITRKAIGRMKNASALLKDFFVKTVRKVTLVVGVVIALSQLGIDIGPILAGIGVVGFVLGFALQGTLSNFASGIMLLVYRPYDVGDAVTAGGVTGTVDAMSLVSTTIKTFDNQNVVVPNSSIWGNVITNITGNDTRRVDMTFGIGYSDDIAKAQGILENIVGSHPKILKEPGWVIKLHELADSSVNFIVRPWTKTSDYWDVYWDVTRAVKERFAAEGVTIPFPQRDVHLHQ